MINKQLNQHEENLILNQDYTLNLKQIEINQNILNQIPNCEKLYQVNDFPKFTIIDYINKRDNINIKQVYIYDQADTKEKKIIFFDEDDNRYEIIISKLNSVVEDLFEGNINGFNCKVLFNNKWEIIFQAKSFFYEEYYNNYISAQFQTIGEQFNLNLTPQIKLNLKDLSKFTINDNQQTQIIPIDIISNSPKHGYKVMMCKNHKMVNAIVKVQLNQEETSIIVTPEDPQDKDIYTINVNQIQIIRNNSGLLNIIQNHFIILIL